MWDSNCRNNGLQSLARCSSSTPPSLLRDDLLTDASSQALNDNYPSSCQAKTSLMVC